MKIPMNVLIFTNTTKKTVIAKFEDETFDVGKYVDEHKSRQVKMLDVGVISIKDLVGKAVAAPGEEFDVEKGMALAHARLMTKFYRRFQQAISSMIADSIACQNELLKFEAEIGYKTANTAEKAARLAE